MVLSAAEWNDSMGEVGKELLRERIKNKRASEGLEEIPDDLFAKKPKYDLTREEQEKLQERRLRNKEAAEKSRKKKKEEFEKLQSENDQLNQDKCELVAMITKLKDDIRGLEKKNQGMHLQLEKLKLWIAKRTDEFGLGKHIQKEARRKEKMAGSDSSDSPLLRGDPSLHTVAGSEERRMDSRSPASSPKSASPPPASPDCFQPVGIRTIVSRPQLQTPWLVEQSSREEKDQSLNTDVEEEVVLCSSTAPQPPDQFVVGMPEGQSLQVVEDQPLIYIAKDTNAIYIVQSQDGQQQVVTGIPGLQEVTVGTTEVQAAEISGSIGSSVAAVRGDANDNVPAAEIAKSSASGKENVSQDTTSSYEPSEATAVESLLKLGYKLEKPQPAPETAQLVVSTAPEEVSAVAADHNYEAPDVITVPVAALESAGTVTVTTTSDNVLKHTNTNPLMNRSFQADVIHKLREFGLVVHTIPVGSA